ncbi:hypothetical protein [Massilia horti]|uniref:Uncharacterized protein n=1 Tax=Massilia horti TaxID=2562153 RepID=A0A4Y9SP24_9BURK|nr:hypothetical protein [Massilia horti]TFW28251.1 hypothetical protein E4O92_21620 [Massilia horti]
MRKTCFFIPFLVVTMIASAGERPVGPGESKNCDVGPTEKMFGKTKWLLYGCNDAQTAVIVAAEGNPAAPFYFLVFREVDSYRIYGEGAGDKKASGAAMKELKALNGKALANLVIEANRSRH